MLKMLIIPREILCFPRYEREQSLAWHSVRKASRGVEKHLVTSGVAWRLARNTGAAQ